MSQMIHRYVVRPVKRARMHVLVAFFLALSTSPTVYAQTASATPVGRWQTVSDVTGKSNGVVEIVEAGGELRGRLVEGADPTRFETQRCDKCPGDRHGQPMKGLLILSGLHREGNEWDGGEILDPQNGKVYRAKLKLDDGGKKLLVRGYLGFSLLGRTQTWTRIQ